MFELSQQTGKSRKVPPVVWGAFIVGGILAVLWFAPLAKPASLPLSILRPSSLQAPSRSIKDIVVPLADVGKQFIRKPHGDTFLRRVFTAPSQVPNRVLQIVDPPGLPTNEELAFNRNTSGVPGGPPCIGCIPGDGPGFVPPAPPIPPPAPKPETAAKPAAPPQRIRQGGEVQAAKLVSAPKPVYPPLAKSAHIQGAVRLQAIIGKDGNIQNLSLVSTTWPLFVQAAMQAVKQWQYKPTLLNGDPVEVVTVIDVKFTLTQ